MNAARTTRRTAIFWLASGGIFFFMDMQILGESAIATAPAPQVSHQMSRATAEESMLAATDVAGEDVAVRLVDR